MPAADPAAVRTALDVFARRVARSGDRPALREKRAGAWRATSWREWDAAAREVALGLLGLGVVPGDRVAILAQTRLEWLFCQLGAMMAGAAVVPIYPSNTADECRYVLEDSGAVAAFVEDARQLDKLLAIKDAVPAVRRAVLVTGAAPPGAGDWAMTLADLRARGRAELEADPDRLDGLAAALEPGAIATIVYTSGTTGPPKGVMLTHENLVFSCEAVKDLLGLGEADEQVLFLPLAHSFAQVVAWAALNVGAVTAIAEDIPHLVPNMAEVRPTFVAAVPRVYEKAYARVQDSLADKRKSPLLRPLIDWALARGRERSERLLAGRAAHGWRFRVADKLVFEKIRATFGGRIRYFVSGGAPLSADIARFFHGAGLLILEGYGLTETCATGTLNRPDAVRFGTVGSPVPGVEVRIAGDGEILLRGKNVMKGYWQRDEATREAIDEDGWFHTGDIGQVEPGGQVSITDRKKDILITAGGKNVAPQNLESRLKALCPAVSQVVVLGDRRKYLVALVTLGEEAARDRAAGERAVADGIARLNRELASYETIKHHAVLERDLTEEAGELTPSLKVKRKVVAERYKDVVERLYGEGESAA